MLPHTLNQIRCHTSVQRALSPAGEQIHAGLFHTTGFFCMPTVSSESRRLYPEFKKRSSNSICLVTPAKAGVQPSKNLDSGIRRNDLNSAQQTIYFVA